MTKEQLNEAPIYVVEEEDDDEEIFTLDFDSNTAYQKEEALLVYEAPSLSAIPSTTIIPGDYDGDSLYISSDSIGGGKINTTPPKPSFKEEMNDLLLNTITSKAIGSLLSKHFDLDAEMDKLLHGNRRMGELGHILADEVGNVMYERKKELNRCYAGSEVKYDRIPEWAKSYIREYTRDMIHGLTTLVD